MQRRYAGVIAVHRGRIALVREHYRAWGAPHWNIPSGHVELAETPPEAAVRELAEETGLAVDARDLTLVSTCQGRYRLRRVPELELHGHGPPRRTGSRRSGRQHPRGSLLRT